MQSVPASDQKRKDNDMKERYETPEMEIVEFETEDIITTSDPNGTQPMPF